jgi:hypothetical protein
MLAIVNVPGTSNPMNTHQMYQQAIAQWQPVMKQSSCTISKVTAYIRPTGAHTQPLHHATPHDTTNT